MAPAATAAVPYQHQTSHNFCQPELIGFTLIRPPPIIPPPNSPTLPAPENPPCLLLVRDNLRRKPLLVPSNMAIRDEVV